LLALVAIFAPTWYFNILDVRAFFGDQGKTNQQADSPAKLVRQVELQPAPSDLVQAASEEEPEPLKSDTSILLKTESGANCYLDYADQPMDVKPLITKNPEGWWFPSNCDYKALQAIQVARLTNEEAHQVARQLNPGNIQNLDGIDTYAIAYTIRGDLAPFALEKYIKSLTLPVFADRYYFSTSSAFETRRIGDYTYYLDGDCQGGGSDPCKLWRADSATGTIELLKKNVGLTGKGEVNELKKNLALKFATAQDYAQGVNLILLDQTSGNYKLLRVNQQEWLVFETLEIPTGDSLYSVYYV
jgi:hypothetical protein